MFQETCNMETALSFKRMAVLLHQLEYTPYDTAIALKETYPEITALQLATVLIEVFETPSWQKEQLLRLLHSISNSGFTELQIQQAIASLFPEDKSKLRLKNKLSELIAKINQLELFWAAAYYIGRNASGTSSINIDVIKNSTSMAKRSVNARVRVQDFYRVDWTICHENQWYFLEMSPTASQGMNEATAQLSVHNFSQQDYTLKENQSVILYSFLYPNEICVLEPISSKQMLNYRYLWLRDAMYP